MTQLDDNDVKEKARKLFAGACDFVAGAMTLEQLPPMGLPEVAFIGRSNVGKSSLVNALTNRTALARVSQTPGRTRQLNFFNLGGRLMLVDLPGYGYAKAPKDEIKEWNFLIKDYLRGRTTLQRVLLLVDARHGLKDSDIEFLKLLNTSAVATQVVLTKADAVSTPALEKTSAMVLAALKKHPAAFPAVMAVSSEKNRGIEELRTYIYGLTAR